MLTWFIKGNAKEKEQSQKDLQDKTPRVVEELKKT